MAIQSPDRLNHKAGSAELARIVQETTAKLSSDESIQSVHSNHSNADSLDAFVQVAEEEIALLDGEEQTSIKCSTNHGGTKVKTRNYSAEKAVIEATLYPQPRKNKSISADLALKTHHLKTMRN